MGLISKEESVAPSGMFTDSKYLIFETAQPYPGYHGNLPEIYNPESFFLVTKESYEDEKIVRAIMDVKKNLRFSFDGAPATIIHNHNNFYYVIRIRHINAPNLPVLLDAFHECGIELAKNKKMNEFSAILKIRKFFNIQKLTEGIYEDMDQKLFSYLMIPNYLCWKDFRSMTLNLKYNIDDNNFDAARGQIYYENGLLDVVRIYDHHSSLEKLTFIRDKYLEYISKL